MHIVCMVSLSRPKINPGRQLQPATKSVLKITHCDLVTLGQILSYAVRLFTPKTQTSKRKIDLGPTVMKELKKWRMACPKNDLDLVFPNEAGNHINNKNKLRRHFRPALQTAGCPSIRFHDLRHTNASLRLENGENIKYI